MTVSLTASFLRRSGALLHSRILNRWSLTPSILLLILLSNAICFSAYAQDQFTVLEYAINQNDIKLAKQALSSIDTNDSRYKLLVCQAIIDGREAIFHEMAPKGIDNIRCSNGGPYRSALQWVVRNYKNGPDSTPLSYGSATSRMYLDAIAATTNADELYEIGVKANFAESKIALDRAFALGYKTNDMVYSTDGSEGGQHPLIVMIKSKAFPWSDSFLHDVKQLIDRIDVNGKILRPAIHELSDQKVSQNATGYVKGYVGFRAAQVPLLVHLMYTENVNSKGMLEVVRYLLQKGAQVNASSPIGETALLVAIEKYLGEEMIQTLVKAGADTKSPGAVLGGYSNIFRDVSPIDLAMVRNYREAVDQLMKAEH